MPPIRVLAVVPAVGTIKISRLVCDGMEKGWAKSDAKMLLVVVLMPRRVQVIKVLVPPSCTVQGTFVPAPMFVPAPLEQLINICRPRICMLVADQKKDNGWEMPMPVPPGFIQ